MYILGSTYFWKFLETCDPPYLSETTETLGSAIAEVLGGGWKIERPDPEVIRRWSKGSFNEPGEQNLKYPGLPYIYERNHEGGTERWIAQISVTRIPHIKGLYSNRSCNHLLPPRAEQELSIRLVGDGLADVFTRAGDATLVGTATGLYAYQKLSQISALKDQAESSKYIPPGSELGEMLESLRTILNGGRHAASQVTEIRNESARIGNFLQTCDTRVLESLGHERLQTLLRSAQVSADEWLKAGSRTVLQRLLGRLSQPS